jgi:hypothetical protein
MNRPLYQLKRSLVLVVLAAALTGFWPPESGPVAQAKSGGVQDQELWTMTAEPEGFIIASDRAGTTCRDATQAEASYFNERDLT